MMTMYNDINWDESDDADYARKKKFPKDISHSSYVTLKKNDMLHILKNQTVRGTESLNE